MGPTGRIARLLTTFIQAFMADAMIKVPAAAIIFPGLPAIYTQVMRNEIGADEGSYLELPGTLMRRWMRRCARAVQRLGRTPSGKPLYLCETAKHRSEALDHVLFCGPRVWGYPFQNSEQ